MPERKVSHPRYGRGIVKQTRYKGFELLVAFENGLRRWVRLDEVLEPGTTWRKEQPGPSPPVFSSECLKSRRMIEAFRLGIVPYDCVEEFTFGRDKEMKQITDWLSCDESSLLIIGEYGTGKTHLMHYALGKALQSGFAVAWVEMDPNETPFHKPKRVYKHLLMNFRYRAKESKQLKGFRDFLREALREGAYQDHIYFKHLIDHNEDIFWEWIEASESIIRPVELYKTYWGYMENKYQFLPALYDYSTAANIYCYLLSSLGWAAKQVLGLKGLLLMFDEAETVSMTNYSYQDEKAIDFLKSLLRTASNDKELLDSPDKSGLNYCGVGIGPSVPFLYKLPSGLKLLFAFTSLDWNYEFIWDGSYRKVPKIHEIERISNVQLAPLSDNALKEVFEHICLLYDSSYQFLEEDIIIDKIFRKVNAQSGRTRLFVKGSVEGLDLVRFYPGRNLEEVFQ